jgi:NTE family protein
MPTALVLSAGGMFAAWEIGVWKALAERFRPDLVVGASAGALNAWCIAGGATPADLEAEWLSASTAKLLEPGLHLTGVLRPGALYAKAKELCARYQPLIPCAITLAEVPRLRMAIARDREITWRHLAAACAIPLGFPPVAIDGKRYIDGGVLGALPLAAAESLGATRVIAVNCLRNWPFRFLRAVLPGPVPGPALEVVLIEPERALGSLYDAVVWKASRIERWIALGERDGNRAWSSTKM